MITKLQAKQARVRASQMCRATNIVLSEQEIENIEVVDEGLSDLYNTGLQIVTYVNTDRVCAKEIIMFPHQTCPEHIHPIVGNYIGKEETFRCRWGTVYLYVEGKRTENPKAIPPANTAQYYTVWKEIVLNPGDQYTLNPNTLHWFQAGDEGAIVSEFSTRSIDETDLFTNPNIERITIICED